MEKDEEDVLGKLIIEMYNIITGLLIYGARSKR